MINAEKTVVIFDDDEDILTLCRFILQRNGWTVHTFVDVLNVVDRCRGIRPGVIVMDNWIPDQGGILATKALKNDPETKHIPVVYFSANNQVRELAAQAGADDWIAKPFKNADLTAILDNALTKLSAG